MSKGRNSSATVLLVSVILATIAPKIIMSNMGWPEARDSQFDKEKAEKLVALGVNYTKEGEIEAAIEAFMQALRWDHTCTDAIKHLAILYSLKGKDEDALEMHKYVARLNPLNVAARLNLAVSRLSAGNLEKGFKEYLEWAPETAKYVKEVHCPHWKGENLEGKKLLVIDDSQASDALFSLGYLKAVKQLGCSITFSTNPELEEIIRCSPYVDFVSTDRQWGPAYDYYVEVKTLPAVVETLTKGSFNKSPHLEVPVNLLQRIGKKMGFNQKNKAVVCYNWPIKFEDEFDQKRYDMHMANPSLASFVANSGDYELVVVHPKLPSNDREFLELLKDVKLITAEKTTYRTFMENMLAEVAQAEIVVSVDSPVAYVAAAMGKRTYLCVPPGCSWRWGRSNETSEWYNNVKIFRQIEIGPWATVTGRLVEELVFKKSGIMPPSKTSQPADSPQNNNMAMAEVAIGELADKISILETKMQRISDPVKLKNVERELTALKAALKKSAPVLNEEVQRLCKQLRQVNMTLWDVEDGVRMCERQKMFGEYFINLARSVYHLNDSRWIYKRKINEILASDIMEEKSYQAYN